jgi:hypothetical protein
MTTPDPDRERGLYAKYRVEKLNGKPVGQCFVLEENDPFAPFALLAYAEACKLTYPQLTRDLIQMAYRWDGE